MLLCCQTVETLANILYSNLGAFLVLIKKWCPEKPCTVFFKSLHSSVTALTLPWKQGIYRKIQVPLRSRWILAVHCQYCPLLTEPGARAHQRSEGRATGCPSSRHPREQLPDPALSSQCPDDNVSPHLCTHTTVSYTWYLQLAASLGCQHSTMKTLRRWSEHCGGPWGWSEGWCILLLHVLGLNGGCSVEQHKPHNCSLFAQSNLSCSSWILV